MLHLNSSLKDLAFKKNTHLKKHALIGNGHISVEIHIEFTEFTLHMSRVNLLGIKSFS